MAPLSLSCPLCCSETFSSHSSLKYHLLSMIDNLLCPSCNERCEDIMDLADHLGRECVNLEKPDENPTIITEAEESHETPIEEEPNVPKIKEEVQDSEYASETNNMSIDADKEPTLHRQQLDQSEIRDDPNMIYTCEMCDMTFSSVQEHLSKYHEGEEVLLETEEQEGTEGAETQEEHTETAFNGNTDEDDNMFDDDESTVDESMDNFASKKVDQKTDPEENIVDKKGKPYTRNLVKVEPEWINENENQEQNEPKEVSPVTTKYIVEGGVVRKITEEEAVEISDKSSIIEVHSCPNCRLQFPNLSHFKKHNCTKAQKIVKMKEESMEKKQQIQKIKEELRYQCTFCQAIYSNLISLNDHMKSHLVQDESGRVQKKTITMTLHICDICNTKFPTYKQLRLHSRIHAPVKAKEVGPPVSYNMLGLQNEENTEPNNKKRQKFECTICGKFYDKEYEEVHMNSHNENEQLMCLVCNKEFDTRENLDFHTKAHSNTKKFACSYCKKSFNDYAALEGHTLNQCHKRDFECQYCGRRFAKPHEKVKHERIHTGEKPHVCEVCGKSFRVGYCLTLHMRTHTGNRPYTCHQCGKRFKSHSVFNHHMKIHSDDRNYKCPFCPKAFKTAVQLAGHKNSHTKPFSCTECNRPFASLFAVKAHMETHKRDNNLKFECWICGASYARSFALRDHMSDSHGQSDIQEKSQVEQALMELEGVTNEAQMDNNTESTDQDQQTVTEEEEYQVTGSETEMCQVQVLSEGVEGDEGYVVHLQEVESSVPIEDNHMEVVEA